MLDKALALYYFIDYKPWTLCRPFKHFNIFNLLQVSFIFMSLKLLKFSQCQTYIGFCLCVA